jgi:hypothetical protein
LCSAPSGPGSRQQILSGSRKAEAALTLIVSRRVLNPSVSFQQC